MPHTHEKKIKLMTSTDLLNAIAALEQPDGVIAFPTDTVYGLGCKINHPQAIQKIYQLKGRSETKPLVLLGVRIESFTPFIQTLPPLASQLMEAYWPGPLTVVLPKTDRVSETVTRGFPTVALRIPDCPLLLDLLALVPDGVLATTSANYSKNPPCLTGKAVRDTFGKQINLLEDDLALKDQVASTVVAVEPDGTLRVLRTGKIIFP